MSTSTTTRVSPRWPESRQIDKLRAEVERQAAVLAAVEALLRLWDEWDGTRPHPGESSPRQRDQLRAALASAPEGDQGVTSSLAQGADR